MQKIIKFITFLIVFFSFWEAFASYCPIKVTPKTLADYMEDTNLKRTYIMQVLANNQKKEREDAIKNWTSIIIPFKSKVREVKSKILEWYRSATRTSDKTESWWLWDASFWSDYDIDMYFWVYSAYEWKDYPEEVWRDYDLIENTWLSLSNAIKSWWNRGFDMSEEVDFWAEWKFSLFSLKDRNNEIITQYKKAIIKGFWINPTEKVITNLHWVDLSIYMNLWDTCQKWEEEETFAWMMEKIEWLFEDFSDNYKEWEEWYELLKWIWWKETFAYRAKEEQIFKDRVWEFWISQKQWELLFANLRDYNWKNPVIWDKKFNNASLKSQSNPQATQESLLEWFFWLISGVWKRSIEASNNELKSEIEQIKSVIAGIEINKNESIIIPKDSWVTPQAEQKNLWWELDSNTLEISIVKTFNKVSKLDFNSTKDKINELYQYEKMWAKSAVKQMNEITRKILKMNIKTSSWIKTLNDAIEKAQESCNAQWTWKWRCIY